MAFPRQVDGRLLPSESADWARADAGHAASKPGGRNEEAGNGALCGAKKRDMTKKNHRKTQKMVNNWFIYGCYMVNDGLYGKTICKWMIWRYPHCRKLPYGESLGSM